MTKPMIPTKNPSKIRKVGSAISWGLGLKYFNPANWNSYKKGQIASTAWHQVRATWRIKKPSEYRKESFQEAIKRKGLKESDLVANELGFKRESLLLYFLAFAIICSSAYFVYEGDLLSAFGAMFVSFACSTSAFIRAFRVWQIRNRKFGSWNEFLHCVEAWLP